MIPLTTKGSHKISFGALKHTILGNLIFIVATSEIDKEIDYGVRFEIGGAENEEENTLDSLEMSQLEEADISSDSNSSNDSI